MAAKPAGETAKGIVAKGRSVLSDRVYGPGEEIELPVDEVISFRESGFLVDPDAPPPPTASGPTFGIA